MNNDLNVTPLEWWESSQIGSAVLIFLWPNITMAMGNKTTNITRGYMVMKWLCFWLYTLTLLKPGWWFGTRNLFFHMLGMSSSQLTPSFFRGVGLNHQPETVHLNPIWQTDDIIRWIREKPSIQITGRCRWVRPGFRFRFPAREIWDVDLQVQKMINAIFVSYPLVICYIAMEIPHKWRF